MKSFKQFVQEKYAPQEVPGFGRETKTVTVYQNPNYDEFQAAFKKTALEEIIRVFKSNGAWYIWPAIIANHDHMREALGVNYTEYDCGIQKRGSHYEIMFPWANEKTQEKRFKEIMSDTGFVRMFKPVKDKVHLSPESMF